MEENIFTVSEVSAHIKNLLEKNTDILCIEGEISNFIRANSGHLYFSLKDTKALIRCVFFSTWGKKIEFYPKNGDKVIIQGKISVYEKDGQYQIVVSHIVLQGIGDLNEKFEQLKNKLHKEGLFNPQRKKKLPKFPQSIGVITSETGAALQDILNTLNRRFPLTVYLFHATVQGVEAPPSLIQGIEFFSRFPVDVVIIGRGGGSFEDLFCFNDEGLARAIYKCPLPVVSAVGHEIDFTICDFVADIRAATPTAAAELVTPSRDELQQRLLKMKQQLSNMVKINMRNTKQLFQIKEKKLQEVHPLHIIHKHQQRLDFLLVKTAYYSQFFKQIKHSFLLKKENILVRMKLIIQQKIDYYSQEIKKNNQILQGHSPMKILEKGYAFVQKDGKLVKTISILATNDHLTIYFKDGQCEVEVKN